MILDSFIDFPPSETCIMPLSKEAPDITSSASGQTEIRSEERFHYAIENSSENFALFDANEKLVVCNANFRRNSLLGVAYLMSGPSFEDMLAALANHGHVAGVDEHHGKEWIAERLAGFRALKPLEYQLSDGRWRQVRYDRLPDGSTIARYLDVTELKRRQHALEESEERYRSLAELSPDGIMVYTDGVIVFVNSSLVRMLGANSSEELIGRQAIEFAAPEEHKRILHDREQVRVGDSESVEEIRLIRLDGSEIYLERVMTVVDWAAKPSFLVIARDNNERRKAEKALRESEARYRLLIETSPIAMVVLNDEKGIVLANTAAVHLYGAESVDNLIGRDTRDLIHPDDRDKISPRRQEVLRGDRPPLSEHAHLRFDGRRLRLDGSVFISESRGIPIEWDGTPSMLLIIRDITELKEREEAQREIEERFSAIFSNSPSAIFLKDLEGRYQFVNQQFETWYGTTQEEIQNKTLHDVRPGKFADSWSAIDREVLETDSVIDRDLDLRFADGSVHSLSQTKFPVHDGHGRTIWIGTIQTDVTERNLAEEQLRQAQKMEAVGQLTGGIAHEFNNLLMVIVGNLEMTMDRVSDDAARKSLSAAMKGAIRGAELTQRLLTFSRKQTLAVTPVDLNDLVLGMHDMLRRMLGETITLETELADNLPKTMTDRGQIEGALLNFVLNSRDATPKGGTIIVRTLSTILDAEAVAKADVEPGNYVSLEIADTGHGMTAETIEQSFEPFFTTKDVGEGTGLGLSVVYGFAKQSGGFVDIASEVGRGTTIRLSLPCAVEEERASGEKSRSRAEPVKSRATILVVEDDADLRALVAGLLINLGYDAVEAEDGRTALARLEERPDIDLLFTDVVLPHGMSGWDIAREGRLLRPGLKVVFTSGYPDKEYGDRFLDDDGSEFVRKPYRKSELAEKLATVLNM